MKALSIQQPWCDLIQNKHKLLEIRSWQTKYRGSLLICSSQKVSSIFKIDKTKTEGEKIYTFDPADPDFNDYLHYGKALFVCDLIKIEPFEKTHCEQAWLQYSPGFFAWHFTNIRAIEPFAVKGKLNFFEIENERIVYT